MTKVLIVYGSRRGKTLATAQVIGETLILKLGFQVELTDIRHIDTYKKRLETFDLLVVGSSIMRNRWVRKVLRFLKRNHFYNQSLALFVSAGQTLNQVQQFGYTREEAREQAVTKYIDPYLDKFRFEPIAKTAFGGVFVRAGQEEVDTWNRSEIEQWAKEVGKMVKPAEAE